MSTQKGNGSRTRAQKHKNRMAFKNDMHDRTPQQARLNALHISEVCQHCKAVIEWKIKYKKYKPLTKPKTCTRCQQRNIRKAYHVLCRECALATRVCAKCLKSADEVDIEPPKPTPEEEQKLKVEMERLIKSFPERKRRAFVRYMEKGKKLEESELESELATKTGEALEGTEPVDVNKQERQRVPHSREELLQKIEQLKLTQENDDDDGDDCDFDSDSDDYSNSGTEDKDDNDSDDDENLSKKV